MNKEENKVKNVFLPIVADDLPFNAYQTRGFEFGVLYTQEKEKILPFLYSFFINVRMQKVDLGQKFNFVFDKRSWFAGYNVFQYEEFTFPVLPTQDEYIASIKEHLGNGFYGSSCFDEYYVPVKSSYQRRRFSHGFLLYGFDDTVESVYSTGYTKSGNFEKFPVKYEDMYRALWHNNARTIHYRKLNKAFEYKFDTRKCYEELHQYLNSIYIGVGHTNSEVYGYKVNDGFREYVSEVISKNKMIDIRYARFFFEHKSFMLDRLKYLKNEGYIKDYISQYETVDRIYKTVYMMLLKYNMTGNDSSAARTNEMLLEANQIELSVLGEVLNDLEKCLAKDALNEYKAVLEADDRKKLRDKSRIYNVLNALQTYTDASHYLTTNEILEYLASKNINADKRALSRDIKKLIEIGIDIKISNDGIAHYNIEK